MEWQDHIAQIDSNLLALYRQGLTDGAQAGVRAIMDAITSGDHDRITEILEMPETALYDTRAPRQ